MNSPDALLPLPPATFHILLALADEDRHGYAIIQDVAARTDGELRLERRHALSVDPAHARAGPDRRNQRTGPAPDDDDERRRYYRITPFGRAVARAEARRLAQLLKLARASGFAPGKA